MKNLIFIFSFVFIIISCTQLSRFQGSSLPSDYSFPVKDTLSILAWNVEHFVDEFDNPFIRNQIEDKPKEVSKRIDLLADVLKKIDADVVVFEEFESRALAMKIAKEKLMGMGYRFFGGTESPDWYMNVVIMSKLPLGVSYSYGSIHTPIDGFKDSLGRIETQNNINTRIISAEVRASANFSFILTGVHLKAGRTQRDTASRAGQIRLIQAQTQRFLAEDKRTNLLLVGDFNATPQSKEFKLLLTGNKKAQFIDPLADTKVFSHPAEKPFWRIDHILPNKNMSKFLIPNGVKVAENLDMKVLQAISDHLPLVAKFVIVNN
jgi:endonuclease/exonuclease/phosphatase family metal-dependent hydrolase